jgi:hypothetical protein
MAWEHSDIGQSSPVVWARRLQAVRTRRRLGAATRFDAITAQPLTVLVVPASCAGALWAAFPLRDAGFDDRTRAAAGDGMRAPQT